MVSDNDAAQSDVALQPEAMDTDADGGDEVHVSSEDRLEHPSTSGQVQCSVCSSTFRRPEHLKRHLRSHTKEKPFECAQCGRHFSRTDTLHRHELSHHTPGIDGGKDRTHRITVKTFRACFSCATARVRCSGGSPCGRCESRSLECQYPTERRSKARARNGARPPSGTDTFETEPQPPVASSRPNRNTRRASQAEPEPYQLAQFSVNTLNDPQSSLKFSAVTFPTPTRAPTESISSNGRESISGSVDPRLYMASSTPDLSAGPLPPTVYPTGEGHVEYNGISNDEMPKMFSTEPSANVDSEMGHIQPSIPNSGDIAMDMAVNPEMDLDFDPSFFDPSMLSTINWLPNELFARPENNQGPSFRASSQFSQSALSDNYMTRVPCHPPVINTNQVSPSVPDMFPQTPSGRISMGTELGSPRRHSHVASDASPHSESVDSAKRSADYYVDGGGSRLPRYRKKQALRSASSLDMTSVSESFRDTSPRFNFPSTHAVSMENVSDEVINAVRPIDSTTYNEIYRNFLVLCRNENPFFETFEEDSFPSAEDCSQYLVFYFDSFQTVYPMLHLPTFDPNKCHWLLTLAIVAIGCHCSNSPAADQLTEAFHEMIRRALHIEKEKYRSGEDSLELIQALLLNCIGLLHVGSERAKTSALSTFKDLVFLMNREKLLNASHVPTHEYSDDVMWMKWVQDEIRRRTGYCIWLLDCTIAYSCQDRPLLSLDDGQAALPAHESWWQANSAKAWKQLQENVKNDSQSPSHSQHSSQASLYPTNQSLYDAVHILYIEKRLVSGIGEFSHILLIHALYHRMWEVGDYFRRPLSFWNPTAKKQSRETAIPTGSVWLPGIPSYSKWRNSACDCLDILHWAANSTIAKAAGLEHPTVLHLHVARLVLLTPYQEIRSLATALASNKIRWSKRLQAIEWQYIWRWVRHDQYKARLSIIHAGVTLWHVRRYSTNAYHEPTAAFLAVLTLWAYGSCHAHAPEPSLQGSRTDTQEPSFIHLDRPCDDELVQLFVREGHSMRGNVTGVGDICGLEGPERVLRVGCEILSSLTAWGNSKRFATILNRLADLASRNSVGEQGSNDRTEND